MAAAESPNGGLSPDIEKLASQLAKDPRSRAFIPLAEEYAKAGMLQEAATVLEDGLKTYPTFVTALVALGRVYVQMDQTPKALKVLEDAVKFSPDNVLAHRILARLYAKQKSWDLARRSCDRVLFEFPKDEEMLLLKSEIDAPGTPQAARPAPSEAPSDASAAPSEPAAREPGQPLASAPREAPAERIAPGGPAATVSAPPPPVPTEPVEAAAAAPSTSPSDAPPAVAARVERLQSLLARIQARRSS